MQRLLTSTGFKPSARASASAGFTLLEVLLAITIAGFVLAAASTMLVSVTTIWANRQQTHFFEDHVDGVTEFLQACFVQAGTEVALETPDQETDASNPATNENAPAAVPRESSTVGDNSQRRILNPGANRANPSTGGGSLLRLSPDPIAWSKLPGAPSFQEPSLNFKLQKTPPLLVSGDKAPLIGIDAFLHFDEEEGLSLLWYSLLQEEIEDENDLRRTQISPFVTDLKFIYWDDRFESWEEEDEPREGETDEFLLPRFLKLTFQKEEITTERTISLPIKSRSALLF